MVTIASSIASRFAPGVCTVLKMVHGQTTYNVASVRLTAPVCGEGLTIGAVSAASVEAKVEAVEDLTGERVAITIESPDGAASLPLGTFVVSECKAGEAVTSVVAYDAACYALSGDYTPDTNNPPATALAVLGDIAAQCGLVLGDTTGLTDQTVTGDLTGYMAALLGCNAVIDRTGALALRWFADHGQAVTPDVYYSGGLRLDGPQTLAGLRMVRKSRTTSTSADGITTETDTTTTYSAGTGTGLVLEVDNPFATQAIVNAVWTALHGAVTTYRTGTCSLFGGLTLEPGDLVAITDTDNNTCVFPAMTVTLELDGGCKALISAGGESETALAANVQGPTGRLLSKIQADIGAFKELTSENFAAAVAKVNNLYADEAWVQRLFAQHLTAESLIIRGDSRFCGTLDAGPSTIAGVSFGGIRDEYNRIKYLRSNSHVPGLPQCTWESAPDSSLPTPSAPIKLTAIGFKNDSAGPYNIKNVPVSIFDGNGNVTRVTFGLLNRGEEQIVRVDNEEYRPLALDTFSVNVSFSRYLSQGESYKVTLYFGCDGDLAASGTISEEGTALAQKYAAISHTHSGIYLPLTGGDITGDLSVLSLPMVLSSGTVTKRSFCPSYVTNSSKRLAMNFPLSRPLASGATITCTDLSIAIFLPAGGCPYALSGSTYTQLGSNFVTVWENGESKRSGEVTGITCENYGESIRVNVSFANTLRVNAGSTVVANYSTPTVVAEATFTIS